MHARKTRGGSWAGDALASRHQYAEGRNAAVALEMAALAVLAVLAAVLWWRFGRR